ncbi:hypothetical protein KW805_04800 [Candidatus Pacearchaeota archaeon]|nr:hypothetical protein [Candidatus Pacearchaeota archaeon]
MENFIKKVLEGKGDDDSHRYFVRFGKGDYARRFLISMTKGSKIKVKASFELANDLVRFVRDIGNVKFSGKVLSKDKVEGIEGRKKAGVFVYEVSDSSLHEFHSAYYYLVDANNGDIVLKIKKSLPKPGKNEEKIDDKFCSLEVPEKHWHDLKQAFFWDAPEGKKISIAHELKIRDIVFPRDEKDPVKIREKAKRKGTLVRAITVDGNETKRDYPLEG